MPESEPDSERCPFFVSRTSLSFHQEKLRHLRSAETRERRVRSPLVAQVAILSRSLADKWTHPHPRFR